MTKLVQWRTSIEDLLDLYFITITKAEEYIIDRPNISYEVIITIGETKHSVELHVTKKDRKNT